MDDAEFETLASLLEREGPLPVDRALALLREATKTLTEVHNAGILHCDLQPATTLVTRDGRVLFAESQLARRQDEVRQPDAPGTERYLAPLYYPPEAAHARPLDKRTDLFLLGATFYHAMLGRPPFDGPDPESRALRYIRSDIPPLDQQLPGVPVLVNVMIQKLLRRNPDERYQSAQELAAAIERAERMLQKRQPVRHPAAASKTTPGAAGAGAASAAALAPAEVAEAEAPRRPKTHRLAAQGAAAAREGAKAPTPGTTPAKHPTTARAKALKKPFWQSRHFPYYAAAAGAFVLLAILIFALSGGGRQQAVLPGGPATSVVPIVTRPSTRTAVAPPDKETKPKTEVAKPKPKTATPPKPKTDAPPKPKEPVAEPPKKRWAPVKGTAAGTETYEEFLARTKGLEVVSAEDYIIKWEFAGPYQQPDSKERTGPYDYEYPPEKPGESPTWAPLTPGADPGKPWLLDFKRTREVAQVATEHAAIYVRTRVYSPTTQEVQAWLGSDDAVKLWLNGQLVHANRRDRACRQDEDKFRVTLKEGWNDVMAKISQGGGEWGFCLRFRTLDGGELKGIKVDPAGR